MSIDDKKQALIDAGVKVRSNASDETIEKLWLDGVGPDGEEGVDGAETSEVSSFENPPATVESEPVKSKGGKATREDFDKFHALHATNQGGVRTPAVFDWAMENLPVSLWNEIYAGKRYNGEILKARA